MKAPAIDALARELAITRYALPPCLHIAVAARDEVAIERYIGHIERALTIDGRKALLVVAYDAPKAEAGLPIWETAGVEVLHATRQVWVDVNYRSYRAAYAAALPEDDLGNRVLDHVMNRRVARLKGFQYLRIVPISRAANSSSGGLSEKWAVAYHSTPEMIAKHNTAGTFIQYADLGDIVKMLNLKTGGSLQDSVNDAQALVRPR